MRGSLSIMGKPNYVFRAQNPAVRVCSLLHLPQNLFPF